MDTRKAWISNLPSVTSGVVVKDFYEEAPDFGDGDEAEKRKRFNLKECRQRRKERHEVKTPPISESDKDNVSSV